MTVTPYRNYPLIDEDGRQAAVSIADILHDFTLAVDSDVNTILEAQDTVNEDVEAELDTIRADIAVVETDIATVNTARIDGDKSAEFTKLINSITRTFDTNQITGAIEGNKTTSLITRNVDGTLNTWREVITLSTGTITRNYTANYNFGQLASVSYV